MDSNKKQISILGCGWLGTPLATALLPRDYFIKGSTTSESKIASLRDLGIATYLIKLSENGTEGNLIQFLENSETLIIDIPPKLRGDNKENFVKKITNIIPEIENSAVKHVLFVSSTSVYGNTNSVATEETPTFPETESGRQLVETENVLRSNSNFQTTILRFGGLIGGDRQPGKYLAGKKNLDNPSGPVNLIHQSDCIAIIIRIIESAVWNETFNAVAPSHPTREKYYTAKAIAQNLSLPSFNHQDETMGKVVDGSKLMKQLNYKFIHDLM